MIIVTVKDNSISITGHACRKASDGIDRACAAVSALTCSLINSLQDLTHDRVQAMAESGMTVIRWENLSDGGKLLVDSWFLGLTDVNREYNCIEFQK
nr:MAG TPA: YsxB-like protein [Caudoviricetes sp.]